MKIVTYNIQFGLGKDGHFDLERVAGEVDGADIIALQEVERNWERSGYVDQGIDIEAFLMAAMVGEAEGVDSEAYSSVSGFHFFFRI